MMGTRPRRGQIFIALMIAALIAPWIQAPAIAHGPAHPHRHRSIIHSHVRYHQPAFAWGQTPES